MQQVIIDCQTGKVSYIELSANEETQRLAEIEKNRAEAEALERAGLKRLLLQELVELREMREQPLIFTASDIAQKQARVTALRQALA